MLLNADHGGFVKQAPAFADDEDSHAAVRPTVPCDQPQFMHICRDRENAGSSQRLFGAKFNIQGDGGWIRIRGIPPAVLVNKVDPCTLGALRDAARHT